MDRKKELFRVFNDFFDHVYLITLKRSTDRHELVKYTLDGLDYTIFQAVDGQELNIDELMEKGLYNPYHTKLLRKRMGKRATNISRAHLGCSLSHVGVYKEALEKGYEKILIFEDDLVLEPSAIDSTIKALQELPENWELLRLGHFGANSDPSLLLKFQKSILQTFAHFFQQFERLKMHDPEVINRWFARTYSEHLELAGHHFGNHAYAVTQKGAQKILNFQTPVLQSADNAVSELSAYGWLHAFNLKERLFYQNDDLTSTIAGQP